MPACVLSLILCDPTDCSPPGSPSLGFSRQESWSGWPFPPPGDLPHPGIKPELPALQADSLLSEPLRKPPWSGCRAANKPTSKDVGTQLLLIWELEGTVLSAQLHKGRDPPPPLPGPPPPPSSPGLSDFSL